MHPTTSPRFEPGIRMHKLPEPQPDHSSAKRPTGAPSTALFVQLRKHGLVHEHSLAATITAHVDLGICLSAVPVGHAETA
jgi:hypothetical protein